MATKYITITLSLLLFPLLLTAQTQRGEYLKIDYLTVTQPQMERFTDSVVNQLKEYHSDRVEDGEIDTWTIYRVLFSGSASNTYNYVSITTAASLDSFDELSNTHPNRIQEFSDQNRYSINKSELWSVRNTLSDSTVDVPSNYLMMDYMDVRLGRELEYQMLEDEVAKPLHEQRMDQDIMEDWEMYQLISPGGIDYGYNFATGNYFSSLSHIEFGFNEELIRSQNPNVDLMEFFDHIWSTRDLVRSELWKRIDYLTSGASDN